MKKKNNGGLKYTVQGEWFPAESPAMPERNRWGKSGETTLDTEMRLFCACTRWAFNRLLEGKNRVELKKEGQVLFGLNSRYVDDAILKAWFVIGSQRELLEQEIQETETKLKRAKRKLSVAEKKLSRTEKQGSQTSDLEPYRRAVKERRLGVKSLEEKLIGLQAHQEKSTIPKVVFGGRALWRKVCKKQVPVEKWRSARQNRLYTRGDKAKGGNPHFKLLLTEEGFQMEVAISHLAEARGYDRLSRPRTGYAPRVKGQLWLPQKHRSKVQFLLLAGTPYTVELIRGQDNRYRAHIVFELYRPETVTGWGRSCIGLDINPDGVALCNLNHQGQPEPWPAGFAVPYPQALHKFQGELKVIQHANGFIYLRMPELGYSRGFRRTYLTGVLAKVVVGVAEALGKPVALEELGFGKGRLDASRKFNRMASNFPFRKMAEAVIRRAVKDGVGFVQVKPRHTSTIGWWKYGERYAVPVHCAAALVIGRRAVGYEERITGELRCKIQAIKEKLCRKVDSLPGEGKGMTRKVKRLLGELGDKLLMHNGLCRWKQEGFYSLWHDFRELALLLR